MCASVCISALFARVRPPSQHLTHPSIYTCSFQNDNVNDLNVTWNDTTETVLIKIPGGNRALLGTGNPNPNYVIIKIEASENWTGWISSMSVSQIT